MAGLDDSDSSALTQSGDEAEESSPPPQDPSRQGTEVGTEAGEEENAEMAERPSPGGFHSSSFQGWFVALRRCLPPRHTEPRPVPKITKVQKGPKKGASTRTRSAAATSSFRTTKKRKR
jgi:hypothetical protein